LRKEDVHIREVTVTKENSLLGDIVAGIGASVAYVTGEALGGPLGGVAAADAILSQFNQKSTDNETGSSVHQASNLSFGNTLGS